MQNINDQDIFDILGITSEEIDALADKNPASDLAAIDPDAQSVASAWDCEREERKRVDAIREREFQRFLRRKMIRMPHLEDPNFVDSEDEDENVDYEECDEDDDFGLSHAQARFTRFAPLRDAKGPQTIRVQCTLQGQTIWASWADADALEFDRPTLLNAFAVTEIFDPRFQRRAFADIDARVSSLDMLKRAFAQAFGLDAATIVSLETKKGYHLLGPLGTWRTAAEQRQGLDMFAALLPHDKIDKQPNHSLRLAGTLKPKDPARSRKELPAGTRLADTLVQPLGAPRDSTYEYMRRLKQEKAAQRAQDQEERPDDERERLTAALTFLTPTPEAYSFRRQNGEVYEYDRVASSYCNLCRRDHDHDGAYVVLAMGKILAGCRRQAKAREVRYAPPPTTVGEEPPAPTEVKTAAVVAKKVHSTYPGRLEPKARAETYFLEGGLRKAPPGDYLEGSPCGLGKTVQAHASIPKGTSVVCISYRRVFSAAQAARYNYEIYSNLTGQILMTPGRRVIVQIDSAHRIEGIPDVLLLDEVHGLRRQCTSTAKHLPSFKTIQALVSGAQRLIALDADANDEDLRFLEAMRGRPIHFERNTVQPHAGKTIYVTESAKEWHSLLESEIAHRQEQTQAWRLANKFTIITQTPDAVEQLSAMLRKYNIEHKAYHGKTDRKVKEADFANTTESWAPCEAIIYNGCLEAGVSVEGTEWKTCWALFQGIGQVEAAKQGLHRFRATTRYIMSLSGAGGARGPQTLEGLKRWLEWADAPMANFPNWVQERDRTNADVVKGQYAQWWQADQLEANRSQAHWRPRLLAQLAETGFSVKESKDLEERESKKPEPVAIPTVADQFPLSKVERVLRADATIMKGRETETPMTSAEIHGTDKRIFIDAYELKEHEVTPALLKQFNTKSKMSTYRRLKRLYSCGASHTEAVKAIGESERPKALPAMMSEYEKESIALEVLNLLGFADMDDARGQEAKAIDKAIKDNPDKLARIYARRNNARLCAQPKKPPDTTKAHLGALNSILDAILGLKVIKGDTTNRSQSHIIKTQWPGQMLTWTPYNVIETSAVF